MSAHIDPALPADGAEAPDARDPLPYISYGVGDVDAKIFRTPARDKTAWWLANAALRLATPRYRAFIEGSIHYGLAAAKRDVAEGRPSPFECSDSVPPEGPPAGATP